MPTQAPPMPEGLSFVYREGLLADFRVHVGVPSCTMRVSDGLLAGD
jgi:hypothetical protein